MSRLKKILLSVFVILTFVAYVFQQKHDVEGGVKLTLPATNQNNTTPSPTTPTATTPSTTTTTATTYKDGTYTGSVADAFYGNIQVQVVIQSGKITDVIFLQHPQDRSTSVYINSQAMPILKEEAIQTQSANVDLVSGATDSSNAFVQSLQAALSQAQA